ncbi:MAG: DMT family transporter [Chloroflexota bacterium]|nr:DMT family transporter [Chloroflexota bacterium]
MTVLALSLVLSSAVLHATWNLFAKRAGGGAAFVWLFNALSALIYAPFALGAFLVQRPHIGPVEIAFMAGSTVLHTVYFLTLQRGYRVGDLSLVYPIARGTGPALSTTAAILIFGERPTPVAIGGALLIAVSVFALTGGGRRSSDPARRRTAVIYGLITGVLIASYTLWDKRAVSALLIPPLLFDWTNALGRTVLLTPHALRHWETIRVEWRDHRRAVFVVAIFSPLAYILVLTALVFTPVSYIAPAREISILIGTIMGARLLSEGDSRRRMIAAGGMVLGVIALAVG